MPSVKRLTEASQLLRNVQRRIAKKYNLKADDVVVDPLDFMMTLAAGDWPDDVIKSAVAGTADDPKGKPVPLDVRMEANIVVLRYMRPTLAAIDTKIIDGREPLPDATNQVAEFMKIPEMRHQIEQLQIALASQPKRLEAPAILDLTVKDAEFEEISNGAAPDPSTTSDSPGEDSVRL